MYAKKDLLELTDLTVDDFEKIFSLTKSLKKKPYKKSLKNKTIALIFDKSSTRTRVSFEVGISELGGRSLFLSPNEIQIGRGETIEDTARVLSRYVSGIIIRTYEHEKVINFAKNSDVPIINGLTDMAHPCQVLTDMFTIIEKRKTLIGQKIVFLGDCKNNMAYSWLLGSSILGLHIVFSGPKNYFPDKVILNKAEQYSKRSDAVIEFCEDPIKACKSADVIYTDVWTSMGQEKESLKRKKIFSDWQVNSKLMEVAKKDAIFMHCLPAHRGEEVTEEVIDGPQSVIFDQAENRLHVQKAILTRLMK